MDRIEIEENAIEIWKVAMDLMEHYEIPKEIALKLAVAGAQIEAARDIQSALFQIKGELE